MFITENSNFVLAMVLDPPVERETSPRRLAVGLAKFSVFGTCYSTAQSTFPAVAELVFGMPVESY